MGQRRWLLIREEFVRQSSDFERAISRATSTPDITAASEQLDSMMSKFADDTDGMRSGG
jgi:hypothetical protein